LEEFKLNKQELIDTLFEIYNIAQQKKSNKKFRYPPKMIFSAQGGIGTHDEDDFLHQYYHLESTGWGTPFLLVPEATTVDEDTLKLLGAAKEKDVVLSHNSPLGVRFHYLKGSTGEKEKLRRIQIGKPGSPCTEKHLAFNTEFTKEPICTASQKYQKLKMEQLQSLDLPEAQYKKQLQQVLDKECLCVGLSNAAAINYEEIFIKTLNAVNICPGPNIANFSQVVSLQTMTDHIYGRKNIITNNNRPNMFIAELYLYIDFLKEQLENNLQPEADPKIKKYHAAFYQNLRDGINYYRQLPVISKAGRKLFVEALDFASLELDSLNYQFSFCTELVID
jgi:hypothetical protein